MDNSALQHVYATNLRQNYGYPLRKPEPNNRLGEPYATEGLQIGDVGYVDDHGEFIWLFNVKFPLPPKENIPYEFRDRNLDTPEKLVDFPEPVPERGFDPGMMLLTGVQSVVREQPNPTYEFVVKSKTGAMLILPDGATLSKLEGEEKLKEFQQHAAKHAIEWCRYARRNSLYLVTDVYKTKSWTLGSFYDGSLDTNILIRRQSGDSSTPYFWDCPFTVDRRQGPGNNCNINQTVLIKGFKITVRWDWLCMIERVERSERWFTRVLATLFPIMKSREWLSRKKVKHFPARNLSQPLHPLDVVNRVLLDKNRNAHVAVAHDDAWIGMLKEGLSYTDLMQEARLREFMEKEHAWYLNPDYNSVHLRSKLGSTNSQAKPETDLEEFFPLSTLSDVSRFAITNMRLEGFDLDPIYAGVCILIEFGGMVRRSQNKPHASVIEWDDEIMLHSGLPINITVCGTFQLGSTLGIREICKRQTIYTTNLSGVIFTANFSVGKAGLASLLITMVQQRHFSHLGVHPNCDEYSVFEQKTDLGFKALYSNHDEPNEENLKDALECFQYALEQCGPDQAYRATALFNLASSKLVWYHANGIYSELNTSIELYGEALKLRGPGDIDRSATLLLLAQALLLRYGRESDASVAEQIKDLLAEIHSDGSRNHQTADAIMRTCRFYQTVNSGNLADICKLPSSLDRHTYAPPYGFLDWPHMLYKLGVAFATRFQLSISLRDLIKSLILNKGTLHLNPDGHDRASIVAYLNHSLKRLLEVRGDPTDIDILDVLTQLLEAVISEFNPRNLYPQAHPCHPLSLKNLVIDLIDDLEQAIALHQEALVHLLQGHQDRPISLDNLALSFFTRFRQLGVGEDLKQAITLHRGALDLLPQGHPRRSISLDNVALCLSTSFNRFGVLGDLEEAIALYREVLDFRLLGDPGCLTSLDNLALCLSTRFNQLGSMRDLDEAIVLNRETLRLRPPGHPGHSVSLNTLAVNLATRYNKLGATRDLDEAITLSGKTLQYRLFGHPNHLMSLDNLALPCLSTRFNHLAPVQDLDEAIVLCREALQLRPPGHPDFPMSLNTLAVNLTIRYNKLGALQDLNEAIVLNREALRLRPLGHPGYSMSLNNLAVNLATQYNKFGPQLSESSDLDELFALYTRLADLPHVMSLMDLSISRAWIRDAERFKHSSTILAYETSIRLLTRYMFDLRPLPQHLDALSTRASSLAADAFSACLRNRALDHAIELLEQSRDVFWNLHSPLDSVIKSSPDGKTLAKKINQLTSFIHNIPDSPSVNQHERLWYLNLKMQSVVTTIRALPGHSRFLLPPLFSELQRAASGGPVIIVNASQHGCDVLVIFIDRDPVHIPLSVTKQCVRRLSSDLRYSTTHRKSLDMVEVLRPILRELWDDIVSPIASLLQTTHPLGSRIWWCPTAEFSDLPLHAAGPHRKGQQNLADLYISSYTPTLSALIHARRAGSSALASNAKHFVAIGRAGAGGQTQFPSVNAELDIVSQRIHSLATLTRFEGEESRFSRVVEELGKNEWVHLACRGLLNRDDPFESAFALYDKLLTIEHIIGCDLQNSEFAYLSACHTTVGDRVSPDEAIHPAAAMLFAGFRSVVCTMWGVDHSEMDKITSTFYEHMVDESGRLDHTRAAFALNKAVRSPGVTLDQRALYVHIGA